MRTMAAIACFVALGLCGGPATAQSSSNGPTTADGFPLPLNPPPPATGTPQFYVQPPVIAPPSGCAAAFDCRVRVLGAIQHNGAVELNASIFKW
jgi:hypothetical protein